VGSEASLLASGHFTLSATMFSFLWRSKPVTDEAKAASGNAKMLAFDPSSIVQAITFHLLDERKARAINLKSSEVAINKLSQRMSCLTIPAAHWAAMDNVQRLQWLLKQSRIVVKSAPSRPAMLAVRRWQLPVFKES
jgi:hypothetical protein